MTGLLEIRRESFAHVSMAARSWANWRALVAASAAALVAIVLLLMSGAGRALIVETPVEHADAIVSLASHEWERLPSTVDLARRMPSAVVLLTEPVAVNEYNCHDCGRRVEVLVGAGVDQDRIVTLTRKVTRTFDEAIAAREWSQQHGVRSVVVVTSPYHTRRALATFQHIFQSTGIHVGVQPASKYSPALADGWWWREYDREYVAYEWSAALFYRVRFGVGL